MNPLAVHPRWFPALPDTTRFVTVAGLQLSVAVHERADGHVAVHQATRCFGVGATVEQALADVALMLANDRDWYCYGAGSYLILSSAECERRAALRRVFGDQP